MIAVIHQPHFLPWLGYINKLANADMFVVQDDVQFRRRYFQNRTIIRSVQNNPLWQTVPIHAHKNTLIKEVVAVGDKWKNKFQKNIYYSYCRSPYFSKYFQHITSKVVSSETLLDININALVAILDILDIKVEIRYSSEFQLLGSPTEKLVTTCHRVGANKYIFGEGGGVEYHGLSMFKDHGIQTYRQSFLSNYLPIAKEYYKPACNISVIDYLFNIGAKNTRAIINKCWVISKG